MNEKHLANDVWGCLLSQWLGGPNYHFGSVLFFVFAPSKISIVPKIKDASHTLTYHFGSALFFGFGTPKFSRVPKISKDKVCFPNSHTIEVYL